MIVIVVVIVDDHENEGGRLNGLITLICLGRDVKLARKAIDDTPRSPVCFRAVARRQVEHSNLKEIMEPDLYEMSRLRWGSRAGNDALPIPGCSDL